MVALTTVRASNTALVQRQPLVAVFFGGTGGIGSFTVRALARIEAAAQSPRGKGLRAYIVGRKETAAEEFIAECRGTYSSGEYVFVKAGDLSLVSEVDRVCGVVRQAEEEKAAAGKGARIDYLMVSQGGAIYQPRKGECFQGALFTFACRGRGFRLEVAVTDL